MTRQHSFRDMAVVQDATAAHDLELAEFWRQLCSGNWIVRDTFATDDRYLALVETSKHDPPRELPPRKLRILESMLLGTPAKVVAIENSRSLSSITMAAQECLRCMGLEVRTSKTSVLLIMAARACRRPQSLPERGRLSELEVDGERYWVVSALRPDRRFPVPLSLAETEVLRGRLAGQSHAQISGARATSTRTVANQLATAFKKLGVSGRQAIIERLIQSSAHQP